MVATLIARIKYTFGISLRASMLYKKIILGSLTCLLTSLQQEEKADLLIQADKQKVWLHDPQLEQQLRLLKEPQCWAGGQYLKAGSLLQESPVLLGHSSSQNCFEN
jgi:hypothetical protein